MSQTADSLMKHLESKREGRAEQESYKRMKLQGNIWARDLKARSARDEREHVMHLAEQDHLHQQERMTQQIEFARLELELSRARREEEEAQIHRIALERGLGNAYHVVLNLKCDYTQQTLQVWDTCFEFTELKRKFPSLGTKEEEELLLDKG
ncbi:hypothetical protein F4604DRAFT_1939718 [Suillus subluteus]|nr:hypothetical protein F4604DRAFT_1939718 [Suillus subluteus]